MAQYSTYYHQDYSGGLNNSSTNKQIKRNQASLLRNWDITYKGQLRRRDGLTQKGDDLTNYCKGFGYYQRAAGQDLLVMDGDTLRYLNSTTWDSLDSGFTDEMVWMENCLVEDKIYISSTSNTIHSWDRSSTTLNSCLTDLGSTVPHGNVLKWHKNHMFTLNSVVVSGTTHYNRIYWSAFGDADTWDTANDFIDLPGQGKAITAESLGEAMVIFKEKSVMFLEGYGDSSWRLSASSNNVANVDEAVGCVAPRGATRVGNEVWFIDDEGNIRRIYQTDFDAFRRDIISSNIQTTIDGLNKTQLSKAVAHTHNDKVYFAVANGASTDNNLVLVYDLQASRRTGEEAWTTYTGWTISDLISYPENVTPDLFVGHATSGKVYEHTGDDDDGVAIDARWDGVSDDYDKPERYKKYAYGYITAENQGDIDITLHSSVDNGSFEQMKVQNSIGGSLESAFNLSGSGSTLGPTGSFLLGPTGDARLGGSEDLEGKFYFGTGGGTITGKRVKLSIRHNVASEKPKVDGFTVHYKQRSLK